MKRKNFITDRKRRKETVIDQIWLGDHSLKILKQDIFDQYRLQLNYDTGDCNDTEFKMSIDVLSENDLIELAKFFLKVSGRKNLKIK